MLIKPVFPVLIAAMCAVVALSNYLVQFPVNYQIGDINLADLLTWGAFTYPIAFLVTDLANRWGGPDKARKIVFTGFVLAVLLSIVLVSPRIAIASGCAFLLAQLLDVSIFNRLRDGKWWQAPLISSLIGSTLDTCLFFTLAFASGLTMLGANDEFAVSQAPFLGVFATEMPRWVSWAMGDLAVKFLVGLAMLLPYGIASSFIRTPRPA